MYQFMVATTRSDASCGSGHASLSGGADQTIVDISTMSSITSATNKWASRAVVALQLAAWSAVGIVLLEKGVASLQKSNNPIGDTLREPSLRQIPTTSGPTLQESSESILRSDVLSVIPLVTVNDLQSTPLVTNHFPGEQNEQTVDNVSTNRRLVSSSDWSRDTTTVISMIENRNEHKMIKEGSKSINDPEFVKKESEESPKKPDNERIIDKNVRLNRFDSSGGKNIVSSDETKNNGAERKDAAPKVDDGDKSYYNKDTKTSTEGAARDKSAEKNAINEDSSKANEGSSGSEETEDESTRRWSTINRKRLRIAEISGGGAAAAVAMVAVGAVMLVLGPAVIVLRALDERRQERRFLKLSSGDDEDLPPSYEQATGSIEQAPTYSSLNLDTITSTLSSEPTTSSTTLHRDPVELMALSSRRSSLPNHSNQLLL